MIGPIADAVSQDNATRRAEFPAGRFELAPSRAVGVPANSHELSMMDDIFSRRALLSTFPVAATLATDVGRAQPPAAALSPSGGVLASGIYRVDRDLTVTGDLMLMPGATISVAPRRTLTIGGSFFAPIAPVFSGSGVVDLNGSRVPVAYPEWWGARTGDGTYDNLTPLNACLAAHPVMQLQSADYFIPDTWKIAISNRTVRGSGKSWRGPGSATRLIIERPRAGTADVVQIGADRQPGSVEHYVYNVRLSDVHLTRDGLVAPPAPGREIYGPVGLRLQYGVELRIEDVSTENHAIGVYIGGIVHSFVRRCNNARAVAGTRAAGDFYWGFCLDGDIENGFAGGNASIYLEDCAVSGPGPASPIASTAAYLKGGFADSYLINLECAACQKGIRLEGLARHPRGRARRKTGNGDVHIMMPILDQVLNGIELVDLTDYALVDIISPYVASARNAAAAVSARGCGGQVTITGGQLIGWGDSEAGGNAVGIYATNTDGLSSRGLKLLGFRRPVDLDGCANFDLELLINNPDQVASQAAVLLTRCSRGVVGAGIKGRAAAFPAGVELKGDANRSVAVECTMIDPRCLAGGAANTLRVAGAPVRAAGKLESHLVTGLMG
jgi:hypothetical protein